MIPADTQFPFSPALSRRDFFARLLAAALVAPAGIAAAQSSEVAADEGVPFTFDVLTEMMRQSAQAPWSPPAEITGPSADLNYDDYRLVQFRRDHARWAGDMARVVLHAYHPGWLFKTPVRLNEVIDGVSRPMHFTSDDFEYLNDVGEKFPEHEELPGVAGFRINAPINNPSRFDEVVSFLGASYFRALGRGNLYGLSARGLALNTAIGGEEEFPYFSEFWLERPEPGSAHVVFYAALESPSVAGAYRFGLTPGETTVIDVEQRLFFREDVRQLGIAPLTSMFLFGPNDKAPLNDYRTRVHDSEALLVTTGDRTYYRPLRNPEKLGNSYVGATGPTAFGLVQRTREFDEYLDAHAFYEKRPSLIVEPVGDWGKGSVRLIEIPTELESNDNIVAFWVPEGDVKAGDSLSLAYRLHWGLDPLGANTDSARVLRTLSGLGGVAGVEPERDRQKFVIDFESETLKELGDAEDVQIRTTAQNGEITEAILEPLDELGIWRLVLEVKADGDKPVELSAELQDGERRLTETWLYQWTRN